MSDSTPGLNSEQLGAYFALMEVSSLLEYAVDEHLRADGDLSYVQFQILARLVDSPEGRLRMTDLADGVVYSCSGLTYQAGLLEKRGLITRSSSPDDEHSGHRCRPGVDRPCASGACRPGSAVVDRSDGR